MVLDLIYRKSVVNKIGKKDTFEHFFYSSQLSFWIVSHEVLRRPVGVPLLYVPQDLEQCRCSLPADKEACYHHEPAIRRHGDEVQRHFVAVTAVRAVYHGDLICVPGHEVALVLRLKHKELRLIWIAGLLKPLDAVALVRELVFPHF